MIEIAKERLSSVGHKILWLLETWNEISLMWSFSEFLKICCWKSCLLYRETPSEQGWLFATLLHPPPSTTSESRSLNTSWSTVGGASKANGNYEGVIIFMNVFELKTPEIFPGISWHLRNFRKDPIINSNIETLLFTLTPRNGISQVRPPAQPGYTKQMVISVAILASAMHQVI